MGRAKTPPAVAKSALEKLVGLAQKLPQVEWKEHKQSAQFLAKRKTFAWFLNNWRNDGVVAVWCKVFPGENAALIRSAPDRFYLPPYVGMRGWVAYRLDTKDVDWEEVGELLKASYVLSAPASLAAIVRAAEEP